MSVPVPCLPSNWSRSCGTRPKRGDLVWRHWPVARPSCPRRSRSECFASPQVRSLASPHCRGDWQRGQNGHCCGSSLPPGTGSSWPAFSHTDTHTCWGWKCGFSLRMGILNTLRHLVNFTVLTLCINQFKKVIRERTQQENYVYVFY